MERRCSTMGSAFTALLVDCAASVSAILTRRGHFCSRVTIRAVAMCCRQAGEEPNADADLHSCFTDGLRGLGTIRHAHGRCFGQVFVPNKGRAAGVGVTNSNGDANCRMARRDSWCPQHCRTLEDRAHRTPSIRKGTPPVKDECARKRLQRSRICTYQMPCAGLQLLDTTTNSSIATYDTVDTAQELCYCPVTTTQPRSDYSPHRGFGMCR